MLGSVIGGYVADVPVGSESLGLRASMLVAGVLAGAGVIWTVCGFRDNTTDFARLKDDQLPL